jgi:glutamate dehydrogenase (NADP+)
VPSTRSRRPSSFGANVVTMSDSNGYVYDPEGIDFDVRQADQGSRARPHQGVRRARPSAVYHEGQSVPGARSATSHMPCATQNELDLEDAKQLAANGCGTWRRAPTCPPRLEATKYLRQRRVFAPGKAANAGGVATRAWR